MADSNPPPLLPFVRNTEQVEEELYRVTSHCLEELAQLLHRSRSKPRSLNASLDQLSDSAPVVGTLHPIVPLTSPTAHAFTLHADASFIRRVALHRLCCHDDFLFPTVEETLRRLDNPPTPHQDHIMMRPSTTMRMVGSEGSGIQGGLWPGGAHVGAETTTDAFLTLRSERSNATIILLHLCEGTSSPYRSPYGLSSQDALSSEPIHSTHSSVDLSLKRRTAMTLRCNHKVGVEIIPRWVKLQEAVLHCLSAILCTRARSRFDCWRDTSQLLKNERERNKKANQIRPFFMEWRSVVLDHYVRESIRKREAFIASTVRAMNRRRVVRRTLLGEYFQRWRLHLVEERMDGLADAFLYRMSLFNTFSKWHERYTDELSSRMIRRQRLEQCYSIWIRKWRARVEERTLKRMAFKMWNERWKMIRMDRRRLLVTGLRRWKARLRLALRSSILLTPPSCWTRSNTLRGAILLLQSTKETHSSHNLAALSASPLIQEVADIIARVIHRHGIEVSKLVSALVPCQGDATAGSTYSIPSAAKLKDVWRLWRDRTLVQQFRRGRLAPMFQRWRRRATEGVKGKRIMASRNGHLLLTAFELWKEQLAKAKKEKFLIQLFEKDSLVRLKKACFREWCRRFQKLGSRRSSRTRALEFRRQQLLASAWDIWCTNRTRIRQREAADQLHVMHLRRSSWERWRYRWLTLQTLQDARLKCADELFACALKHRVLQRWFDQLQAARKKQAAFCDRRRRVASAFWIWLRRYRIRALRDHTQELSGARSPHRCGTVLEDASWSLNTSAEALSAISHGPAPSRATILRGRLLALHSTTQTRRFFDPLIVKGLHALTVLSESADKVVRSTGSSTARDVGLRNHTGAGLGASFPEEVDEPFRVLECDGEDEDYHNNGFPSPGDASCEYQPLMERQQDFSWNREDEEGYEEVEEADEGQVDQVLDMDLDDEYNESNTQSQSQSQSQSHSYSDSYSPLANDSDSLVIVEV